MKKEPAPTISLAGFTEFGSGIWINESEYNVDGGNLRESGTTFDNFLFIFNNVTYGVRMTTQYGLNASDGTSIYRVSLISDPDGSLNVSSSQASGDELTSEVSVMLVNGSYSLKRNNTFTWYQRVAPLKQNATWLRLSGDQIANLNGSIYGAWLSKTDLYNRTYLRNGWDYLMRNVTSMKDGSRYAYLTYQIDQHFLPLSALSGTDIEQGALGLSHRLMGLFAYNDTSPRNSIMDLNFRSVGNFSEIPFSEAKYVFKASLAHNLTTFSPAYNATDGTVSWNASVSDLNGSLTAVRLGDLDVNATLDEIAFSFQFERSENIAVIKVHEHIGALNIAGDCRVNHLSLASAYFTYFGSKSVPRYETDVTTVDGTPVSAESNSIETPIAEFTANRTMTAYAKIGGNNYIWGFNNSANKADSNVLTWLFFKEQFATVGNRSITTQTNFSDGEHFYQTCFANWSGYGITHDTFFIAFLYTPPLLPPYGQGALLAITLLVGAGIGAAITVVEVTATRLGKRQRAKRPRGHSNWLPQNLLFTCICHTSFG